MPVPPTLATPEVPDHLGREPWGPGLVTHGLALSSKCDQARMPGLFCRLWFPLPVLSPGAVGNPGPGWCKRGRRKRAETGQVCDRLLPTPLWWRRSVTVP